MYVTAMGMVRRRYGETAVDANMNTAVNAPIKYEEEEKTLDVVFNWNFVASNFAQTLLHFFFVFWLVIHIGVRCHTYCAR